ncbi:MAG: hypothetical protein D6B25_01045 [Desulfobulbaceae bacterium]|nr:MAG: hypothetical protein D6B25_01045 [Desulfobulbaceae bacterium]
MKSSVRIILAVLSIGILVTGCNMPTPPSEIPPSYTPGHKYRNFSCESLSIELASLNRREDRLVRAQEKRIKSSKVQAFWWGVGDGDGFEAEELAEVRGDKEAVYDAMDAKGCR